MSEQSFATPSLPFVRVETCDGIDATVAFEVMRDHYGFMLRQQRHGAP